MMLRRFTLLAGMLALGGWLVGLESVVGHGGGSVRPPSGGSRGGGQPSHSSSNAGRGQPGKPPTSTSHSGNVSGGSHGAQSPYGSHNQQPAQHSNNGPYGKPAGNQHPGSRPPYPTTGSTSGTHNYPNSGSVRSPTTAGTGARPANPYGSTTINNNINHTNNAAYANKNNIGSVGTPGYGSRTPYGTPYVGSLPPGARTVPVNGVNYSYAGGNFYQPVYSGGSVTYAQVPPSQMNFTSVSQAPPANPPQQSPEQAAAASLNVAQTLMSQNNPDAKQAAVETLANIISTYPGTPAAQQAQQMLQGLR